MADLERALREVEVEWPATPDVASRLELAPRRRRRALVVAAVALAAAVAAAFAVPQSRGAILRFFHLGGVTVVRVETLPPAEERPLAAGLGDPIDSPSAAIVLGSPFLPLEHGTLYQQYAVVSTLLAGPVLLSEFRGNGVMKKFVATEVEYVEVAPGVRGIWFEGEKHVVAFPSAPPRLAGNVLVFATDALTFRLEAPGLTRAQAIELARTILGTGSR